MSTFPEHVEVIIVGTGLTNSILAAACSRIGKSILHLDENDHYGNFDASFTFQQLIDWIKKKNPENPNLECIPEELTNKSRLFCIDLAPRFLYSNGDMVELLVKSNVARYHEFKNNIRILCLVDQDEIHVMPCRRNEVFTSPLLKNLADKRRLMKFIELCVKYHDEESGGPSTDQDGLNNDGFKLEKSELAEHGNEPIGKYLEQRGLKPVLQEYIINSIAMIHPTDTVKEACKRIKKFMVAIERYGRSPFLFPLYGCGEFPQSFCRLSAVFGGVYCLNTKIKEISLIEQTEHQKEKFRVKFGDDHSVTSDILVIGQQDASNLNLLQKDTNSDGIAIISRAILITNKSVVTSSSTDEEDERANNDFISFLRIPPTADKNANPVYLIELNSSALVCPKDLNIVYMWTKSSSLSTEPEQDLQPTIERIFSRMKSLDTTHDQDEEQQQKDCILWKFFYNQHSRLSPLPNTMDNHLYVTSPPFNEIDYVGIISEAETIFKKMCPDQEFLPRAPDPDEIIHTA